MANPKIKEALLAEALQVYRQFNNKTEAANTLNLRRSTFCGRLDSALKWERERGITVEPSPEPEKATHILKLQGELKQLQDENASLKQREVNITNVKEMIHGDLGIFKPKKWKISKSQHGLTGIPIGFWSDWHWDETVYPEQLNGVNAFNRELAVARARSLFEKTEELLMHHMEKPRYDYIVILLGGDMITGNIHEDLVRNQEEPIMKSVLSVVDTLIDGLTHMIDVFGRVKVKCIFGNHGRLEHKKFYKQRAFENFDWLIAHIVARHFGKNDSIEFEIADSTDLLFNVYDVRYLLTHGDEFKGGDGFAGPFIPWAKGKFRRGARQTSIHDPFDIMCIGHWHQYNHLRDLIVNGTLKGLDELAFARGYGYEPPTQALWVQHPTYGVTARWPVFVSRPGEKYA